jgi:hypothetical protein
LTVLKYFHYILTCYNLITSSPYISKNWQWILMGGKYFAHRNSITLRTSRDQVSSGVDTAR